MDNVTIFLDRTFSLSNIVQCPCSRCHNLRCLEDKRTIVIHLCKNDFVPGYKMWTFHGESGTRVVAEDEHGCDMGNIDRMDKMLETIQAEITKDPPTTEEVEAFFKLLKASEQPRHKHTEVILLAFITQLVDIKSKYFFFNNCYNDLIKLINDILLKTHKVPKDMYQSKKIMSALGLKYENIGICPDNCIFF
jgi:hypothetical protein